MIRLRICSLKYPRSLRSRTVNQLTKKETETESTPVSRKRYLKWNSNWQPPLVAQAKRARGSNGTITCRKKSFMLIWVFQCMYGIRAKATSSSIATNTPIASAIVPPFWKRM